MKIDLAKLDAQIKRLEEVRRIALDPEALALLETVIVNGTSPVASEPQRQARVALMPDHLSDPISQFQEGSFVRAVAEQVVKQEEPFSGYWLAEKMRTEGYQFTSERTKAGAAIADIIRRVLIPKNLARLHKKGRGGDPALYVKV